MLHYSQAPQLTMLPPSLSIFHQGHQHLQRDQSAVGFLLELLELLLSLFARELVGVHRVLEAISQRPLLSAHAVPEGDGLCGLCRQVAEPNVPTKPPLINDIEESVTTWSTIVLMGWNLEGWYILVFKTTGDVTRKRRTRRQTTAHPS